MSNYTHGYADREARRLADQVNTLVELLHSNSRFPLAVSILEAGCGVGAQTVMLASQNTDAQITPLDVSDSPPRAEQRCREAGIAHG